MAEWWQNASFWRDMGPLMFDAQRFERAKEEVDGVLALLGAAPGAHLLDLCCGPGRHAAELARRGFRVTGVDLCEAYLAQAREREPRVEWVHGDMREFRRDRAFDGALNLYSSFGYFEDPGEDLRVARHVRASLRPGARFLIDTMSKEILARLYQPRRWHRHDDGTIVLEECTVADGWHRVRSTFTILRGAERVEHFFENRLYAGSDLDALLREAGFSKVVLFGGFDGRPYDPDAKRLVAVATA